MLVHENTAGLAFTGSSNGENFSLHLEEDVFDVNTGLPIESMELDAVLAQDVPGMPGMIAAADNSNGNTPAMRTGSTKKQNFNDAVLKAERNSSVMSLRNFLEEDVPNFPFSHSAYHHGRKPVHVDEHQKLLQ